MRREHHHHQSNEPLAFSSYKYDASFVSDAGSSKGSSVRYLPLSRLLYTDEEENMLSCERPGRGLVVGEPRRSCRPFWLRHDQIFIINSHVIEPPVLEMAGKKLQLRVNSSTLSTVRLSSLHSSNIQDPQNASCVSRIKLIFSRDQLSAFSEVATDQTHGVLNS